MKNQKTEKRSAPSDFRIHVPVGTEKVQITKAVIRSLLQEGCNLPIADYHIQDEGGRESIVLEFDASGK